MKIEYSKRATSDLRHIADYHARSDEQAVGERIATGIREIVARIVRSPQMGRAVVQRPGVRAALLLHYHYKIFYKIIRKTVRIVHIRHTSRRPWPSD
ncbi:MAG TPA: type II toxin-antitoxin system RelE/ParE family toxin [Candidatus Paceibacterota bacterium]